MTRIAIIGGGPAGLYFAALAQQLDPTREITVWERNAPDDTFGFGVVFSDETLDGIAGADPAVFAGMEAEFARWSDIDIHYRGSVQTSGGHGFAAIARKRLLQILQRRCTELGVDLRFRTQAPPADELSRAYDLVIAADGVNSAIRAKHADVFQPSLDVHGCRYMWLATDRALEAFTFIVAESEHGPLQVHAYPFGTDRSTFIVEMPEDTWRKAGFDRSAARRYGPGESDHASVAGCAELLADHLDGYRLLTNNSKWLQFTTVHNRTWRHGNIVLLGDAAHTAHFSIGSGTKLAMEDALALATSLEAEPGDLAAALDRYERGRRPVVESTQRAAQASLEWFETIRHAVGQEPEQFAFNLLTRSRRVSHDNLRARDPQYAAGVERWFGGERAAPPLFQPYRLGSLELRNRVVAAPVATYTATGEGVVGDTELVHLGGAAFGGAGLVFAGMTAVSPAGRVTPLCPGLWDDAQIPGWRRITDLVHAHSGSAVGVQLSHSGRKGATSVPTRGSLGASLSEGGWRTVAPSALAWGDHPAPHALEEDELGLIAEEFADAARRADASGFDVLELQAGHGFLLSSFLSPLTNRRTDAYGGDLPGRLRFPLGVLDRVRAAWPAHKPLIVRISAVDWAEGGTTIEDSVAVAAALHARGADAIDVSTGEVVPWERPAYGRTYQTPFAARLRAQAGVPVIAVGGYSTYDDANSTILAGRSDLVALGRAQLRDPAWTLHAAAALGHRGPAAYWPRVLRAGSTPPPDGSRQRPALTLRPAAMPDIHHRWRPARQERIV
ncbi:FAD-dependent monooxygenase [Streptomyces sp. NBC_00873]|uniref:oxidoreductase n=1 Tax=unclassified Streptomyces TaxID=2593676 RepID=UPI00386EA479|nr:FAD-dependent monooxygenase [Streptomyces sp. NBC_00873]WSY96726.1 FAD-dependent monooxygenase [Streptomyces sp. NBC_00873]WTA41500.1 FAD-dependent monooxygenase [Streptomyces sp. NBC_00842]WTA48396.1 FAD-dependent monooxygenase [Streptomyces sp. NBC_00842]